MTQHDQAGLFQVLEQLWARFQASKVQLFRLPICHKLSLILNGDALLFLYEVHHEFSFYLLSLLLKIFKLLIFPILMAQIYVLAPDQTKDEFLFRDFIRKIQDILYSHQNLPLLPFLFSNDEAFLNPLLKVLLLYYLIRQLFLSTNFYQLIFLRIFKFHLFLASL